VQCGIALQVIDTFALRDEPVSLEAGQLNPSQDAFADVVSANRGSRDLSLCLGQGDGTFSCAPL